jgi:hypothetical protein
MRHSPSNEQFLRPSFSASCCAAAIIEAELSMPCSEPVPCANSLARSMSTMPSVIPRCQPNYVKR